MLLNNLFCSALTIFFGFYGDRVVVLGICLNLCKFYILVVIDQLTFYFCYYDLF